VLIALIILLALLLLGGCAGEEKSSAPKKPEDVALETSTITPAGAETCLFTGVDGHTVFFPVSAVHPEARCVRLRIVKAIRAHVADFEAQEGVKVPPTTFVLAGVQEFQAVGVRNAIGCFVSSTCTIYLWTGAQMELPATYHELAHRMFAQTDVRHTDPRWGAWRRRQEESNARLLALWGVGKK